MYIYIYTYIHIYIRIYRPLANGLRAPPRPLHLRTGKCIHIFTDIDLHITIHRYRSELFEERIEGAAEAAALANRYIYNICLEI